MGVWVLCPQRGPGAEPLVRNQGAKPPEAESLLCLGRRKKAEKILPNSDKMYLLYLTALHLRENDGCIKTTDISAPNRTAQKNQSRTYLSCQSMVPMNVLATVIRYMASTRSLWQCISISLFSLFWVTVGLI